MRQLVLDTETTGLYPQQGHRIIEVAAIEVVNRRLTGRNVHFRIDPEREIDAGASEIHGMTWEDLKGLPRFRDIATEFIEFARGAQWIIHNAPFDLAFLDAEFGRAQLPLCDSVHTGVIDTLAMAREMFPGKRNNLDALCERFGIDNARRTLHGALVDVELLAEVYLAMTRGQDSLTIDLAAATIAGDGGDAVDGWKVGERPTFVVIEPSAEELDAHIAYLATIANESKGQCIWLRQNN